MALKKDDKLKDAPMQKGYDTLDDMNAAHSSVLKSLIDQDGRYSATEAKEINNGVGKQISFAMLKMEAIRMVGDIPSREDLLLPEKPKAKRGKK